jgi:hypothetical protein
LARLESRRLGVREGLAYSEHATRDGELVAHLRVLPGARAALQDDVGAHHPQQRLRPGEVVGLTADHDRQTRLARADVAPGDGRIQHAHPDRGSGGGDPLRQHGRRRRHVDQRRPGRSARDEPAVAEVHLFDVRRVADHRDDRGGADRRFGGRVAPRRAAVEQCLRLLACPVVHAQDVSRGQQMAGHRTSHDARPHETDGRARLDHGCFPSPVWPACGSTIASARSAPDGPHA